MFYCLDFELLTIKIATLDFFIQKAGFIALKMWKSNFLPFGFGKMDDEYDESSETVFLIFPEDLLSF